MQPRDLERLFQQLLTASVPIVGLSACGSVDAGHRLTPTEGPPFLSDSPDPSAFTPECSTPEWTQVQNDPNVQQSSAERVTMRAVSNSALNPLAEPPVNPPLDQCEQLCGGSPRAEDGAVTMVDGRKVSVRIKLEVRDCEVYTDQQPLQVACKETWTWGAGCFVVGRRPEGFALTGMSGDIGAFLAAMARLEAASVPAFERLARELAAHGTPDAFVGRAMQFAADEVKHTRMAAALAHRFGAQPSFEELPSLPVRELEEVLLDNAVEGCVRETLGALTAHWQATHAQERSVREVMRIVAADETSHAAFAWELEDWAEARLTPAARKRLVEARQEAARAALDEATEPSTEAVHVLGLPTAAQARTLAGGLQHNLWA